ncbi:MAG: hypothetical protein ABI649_08195, partial [Gaiellaceae bacterium]
MAYRLHPLTQVSLAHAPPPCVGCVFWQTGGRRPAAKGKWADRVEDEWGAWGTLYYGDERLLGAMQFAPAEYFPSRRSSGRSMTRPRPACISRTTRRSAMGSSILASST